MRIDSSAILMTVQEFAAAIGKSTSWVYANKNKLQHRKNGGALQFTQEDLGWYLDSIKVTPRQGTRAATRTNTSGRTRKK